MVCGEQSTGKGDLIHARTQRQLLGLNRTPPEPLSCRLIGSDRTLSVRALPPLVAHCVVSLYCGT